MLHPVLRLARRSLAAVVALSDAAPAQVAHDHTAQAPVVIGTAQAILLLSRATPTAEGRSLTEAYVTQPVLSATVRVLGGGLSAHGMLNFEGATLARGELNTGTYGEGYVDRRHPHSYVHELLATAQAAVPVAGRVVPLSLTAGRGFAPFGSDDPMARPFVKYPVNHHLAQVLERAVLVAAARVGPVTAEAGVFNGDEPTGPRSLPNWSRFADSWSARLTLEALTGVELAGSLAYVESPEFREGGGLDQRKRSVVLRVERPAAAGSGSRYLLAEWARTHDDRHGRVAFTYTTFLAEGAFCRRGRWGALRLERTTRPEEERLLDPFRAPRPAIEFAILGRTRWTTVTAAAGTGAVRMGTLTVAPFIEASHAQPRPVDALAAFVPREFYRSDHLWLLSLGGRVNVGRSHRRMGRYGAALARGAHSHHSSPATPSGC